MFIEPYYTGRRRGWVEVISGCMFSGKTEELIRRLRRAEIAGQKVEIFKPGQEVQYHPVDIVSHASSRIHSTPVENHYNILLFASDMDVVGIDEAQFFDDGIVEVVEELTLKGIRVIVAGLDMDHTGRPFGPMATLLAMAEYVTKLHAVCAKCGHNANFSYRKSKTEELRHEAKEIYEPRCRQCFHDVYMAHRA